MSILTSTSRFLTLRPSIRAEGERLTVKTGSVSGLLSLFLNTRRVEVVPSRRTVTITRRIAYLFASSHDIAFDDIHYVDYAYGSFATEWGHTTEGIGRHDEVESYAISIVTRDRQKHPVCAFRGEGAVDTGWFGTFFGDDDLVDFSGTQENESRTFARGLAKLLGVTIGEPIEEMGDMATCPSCGRPTSLYKPTCLYCGAPVDSTTVS